MEKWVKNKS
jgi:hypothetical protein